MNQNYLKRNFKNASKSFIKLNTDKVVDTGTSSRGEQAEARTTEARRDGKVEAQYRLCHIDIEFFANHGKRLDEDNRRYAAKPICDALVNLGFAGDDKDITTETTQRLHANNPYI